MTTEKLSKKQRERIKRIVDNVDLAFYWGKTKEGENYWKDVCNDLLGIIELKKCPHCGELIEDE